MDMVFDDLIEVLHAQARPSRWRHALQMWAIRMAGNLITGIAIGVGVAVGLAFGG